MPSRTARPTFLYALPAARDQKPVQEVRVGPRSRQGCERLGDAGATVDGVTVSAIVLAAGEGTRMRSDRPKPIHMICGRAMVLHVIEALRALRPSTTALVVGHGADRVMAEVSKLARRGPT